MVKRLWECLIYTLEEDWKQLYLIYKMGAQRRKESSEMYLGDVMIKGPKNHFAKKMKAHHIALGRSRDLWGLQRMTLCGKGICGAHSSSGTTQGKGKS